VAFGESPAIKAVSPLCLIFHPLLQQYVACFATYFPRLFHYYQDTLRHVFAKLPHLERAFPSSVFPMATFNCGPSTVTRRHRDSNNLAHGVCAIFAGGDFDHKKGGHIILFDLKVVIQFPSGSTAIIPSAGIAHGNVPIQEGETRVSFTQYCSGWIMRAVDWGYQKKSQICEGKGPEAEALRKKIEKETPQRWDWAMGLFSKIQDLREDREITPHSLHYR
jgi:hypothetical protein